MEALSQPLISTPAGDKGGGLRGRGGGISSQHCNLGRTPLNSGKNNSQRKESFSICSGTTLLALKMPLRGP